MNYQSIPSSLTISVMEAFLDSDVGLIGGFLGMTQDFKMFSPTSTLVLGAGILIL